MVHTTEFHESSCRFSIVTIVKNDLPNIERTLLSVLEQQDRSCFQYIVVDGRSTDGTLEVIEKYRHQIDVLLSEEDAGISDAFNKGVLRARSEWIHFLNSGDTFVSRNTLTDFTKHLDSRFDIVYGQINLIDKSGAHIRTDGRPVLGRSLWKYMCIPHQGIFHNRRLFESTGLYSPAFKIAMDYDLLLRKQNLTIKFVNSPVANMVAGGISQRNHREVFREFFLAKVFNSPRVRLKFLLEYYVMLTKHFLRSKYWGP